MIEITNLSKRFGELTAVGDVSFQVVRGEVLGFLGPNGRQVHHDEDDHGIYRP